jgi:transcriptional antiterminator NusG
MSEKFEWYVLKARTGQENKAKLALQERIESLRLGEYFGEILIPEESYSKMVSGKKRTIKKKFFPGYLLISMVMNDRTWHMIKDTDNISGFIGGTKDRPLPISEEEMERMTGRLKDTARAPSRASINFSEGDSVKVTEGPFSTFVGVVESISDRGKVKVSVSIFGRATPVELDFSQVEKV